MRLRHDTRGILYSVLAFAALAGIARAQEMLDDKEFVAGPRVRSAFRDVVADARNWTVRVFANGKPSAMGVIVREDGWVLTKASRLEGELTCSLLDERVLDAQQQHVWAEHDLALLRMDADGLSVAEWSDRGDPNVGQWLATASHAESPAGVGIVSVQRRAIPFVHVSGVLGVSLDLEAGPATIDEVIADSVAEKAELRSGDVVLRIDDRDIPDGRSMIDFIQEHEPGETVQLQVRRGDEELTFTVTLGHPFGQFLSRIAEQNLMGGELSERRSDFPAVIQHDTVLAPELCGGSVVGLDGRAVGVNIARAGRTESYAIPAAVILPLLEAHFSDGVAEQDRMAGTSLPPAPPSSHRQTN